MSGVVVLHTPFSGFHRSFALRSRAMNCLMNSARRLLPSLLGQRSCAFPSAAVACRHSSSDDQDQKYDAYQNFNTPSPFVVEKPSYRYGHNPTYYKGGPLPRSEKHKDTPYRHLPKMDARKRDKWTKKKALFGQNDYIDILGDGTVKPVDLMTGPLYLRGFKGNELQRLSRRLTFQGKYLERVRPTEFKNIHKQINFLYKRYNHYRGHSNYWGGKQGKNSSRLFNLKKW